MTRGGRDGPAIPKWIPRLVARFYSKFFICVFSVSAHLHALAKLVREIRDREPNHNAHKKYKPLASDTSFGCRCHLWNIQSHSRKRVSNSANTTAMRILWAGQDRSEFAEQAQYSESQQRDSSNPRYHPERGIRTSDAHAAQHSINRRL